MRNAYSTLKIDCSISYDPGLYIVSAFGGSRSS